MLPIDEGNEECLKCKHFDLCNGCIPTYEKDGLPPCGRNIIMSQELYKKLMKEKENKHGFWKSIRSIKGRKKSNT